MSAKHEEVCHVIRIFFESSLGKYNCAKFHHFMTDFREGDFF